MTIVAKATDIALNTQPDSVAGVWNLRGNLLNAWHKIEVLFVEREEIEIPEEIEEVEEEEDIGCKRDKMGYTHDIKHED